MSGFGQDLKFTLLLLRKQKLYTFAVIATLALGIGANTAIFSVVNAVLLRPLPYLDAERLVTIESGDRQKGARQFAGVSPADFRDWQAQATSFEQLAAYSGGGFTLTGVDAPETFPGTRVSTNFFAVASARPLLGRTFESEDGRGQASATIVLSHGLWQRRFGGDPRIIGRTLGNTGTTVIGVMPPDFKYPVGAECWIPLSPDSSEMKLRAERYFGVIGLLKPGVARESAEAEMQTIAARLEAEHPGTNKNITVALTPYRDRLVRDVKPALVVLIAAVGFVLLIASVNVANLQLARSATRRKEMAIRSALGADRFRLLRQMMTESLLLAGAGGLAGLLLALWVRDLLVGLLPETYAYLQLQEMVRLDLRVLGFAVAATLGSGIFFGLIPAWRASRPDVNSWLKEGGRGADAAVHQRTRRALVVAETAIAVVLLVGAGLLLQSFIRRQTADLGFDPQNLATIGVGLPFNRYPDEAARVRFLQQIEEAVAGAPGIDSAALSSGLAFPFLNFRFNLVENPLPAEAVAMYDAVSAGYFRTMRARLISGREFSDLDRAGAPAVALVNESFARQYFAGASPIGKALTVNYLGAKRRAEIVGVVGDHSQGEPGVVQPQIYVPYQQQPWMSASVLVRAKGDVEAARRGVERAIRAIDPAQVFGKTTQTEQTLERAMAEPRLYTALLGAFASLALVLAAIGIYGVVSYGVTERKREIGIRLALGATRRDVLRLVIGQGMATAGGGVAIGVIGALALTRWMESLLYGVGAFDPATFAATSALLLFVALAACYLPARRATRVDPVIALRYE